jgi:hypothetical protein
VDGEALLAEAGEEVVRRGDALAQDRGDLIGAHPLGVLEQEREDAQHRPRGAEAAAGRSDGRVREDAC